MRKTLFIVLLLFIHRLITQVPEGIQVKLRLLNLKSKEVTDLTEEFYGGQGTINFPSWNPAWTKFAYLKYALENQ